jgi:hypothetical protein
LRGLAARPEGVAVMSDPGAAPDELLGDEPYQASSGDDGALAPYADLIAVIDALPVLVREARRRKGHSLRGAAAESGVPVTTLWRLEQGRAYSSIKAMLRYVS